jgi:hypothetical protein
LMFLSYTALGISRVSRVWSGITDLSERLRPDIFDKLEGETIVGDLL